VEKKMRKFLISLFIITGFLTNSFSEKWTNALGLAANIPFARFTFSEEENYDVNQFSYGLEGSYLGISEKNLAIKADFSAGVACTKDLSVQERATDTGFSYGINLGAGRALINDEKMKLALTAMLGIQGIKYSTSEKITYLGNSDAENTNELEVLAFSFGGDLFFSYAIKDSLSLFCNLGLYWIPFGKISGENKSSYQEDGVTYTSKTDNSDMDLVGKFKISPALGLSWNF